ncbi:hypothetical protein, partial [Nocardia rhamnosiphila]
ISQRNFGGHTYPRLAHVGDRTGLELIRTMQQPETRACGACTSGAERRDGPHLHEQADHPPSQATTPPSLAAIERASSPPSSRSTLTFHKQVP